MASNRRVSAGENTHICCHQVRFLGCRYANSAFVTGALPRTPLWELTVLPKPPSCCLLLYVNIADLRQKCFTAPGKVLESFVTKRVGTLSMSSLLLINAFCHLHYITLIFIIIVDYADYQHLSCVLFCN